MNKTIETYISSQDTKQKEVLVKIRKLLRALLPNAEEKLSYGVPSFKEENKSILYAAFRSHIGLYPEPAIIEFFKKELEGYETSKGTIKFKLDEPIPYDLIKKIIIHKFDL